MAKKPHEGPKGQLTKAIINLVLSASQKAHAVLHGKCTIDCATRVGCCMIKKEMLSIF